MSLDHTGDLEMWQLVIEQEPTDEGTFELSFLNPKQGGQYWISDVTKINASDGEIRNMVYPYFRNIWGTDVSVTSSIENVHGEQEDELTPPAVVKTTRTYNITLNEPIDAAFSFELSTIYKDLENTKASTIITVNKPTDVRVSSPPLGKGDGRYTIMCAHPLDPENPDRNSTTAPISIGASANDIEAYLITAMPYLAFRTRVTKPRTGYPSEQLGIRILIHFRDFEMDMPQCYIQPAEGDHEIVPEAMPVYDS